jgi:hypothetical protein
MRIKALAGLAGVAFAASLAFAGGAQADSFDSGSGYPRFAHEDVYPENSGCKYRLTRSAKGNWRGRTIALRYYYSRGCGSFARIDNSPQDCSVFLDRTPDSNTVGRFDHVGETTDDGIDFAYTKVGNNLGGRLSRGALACGSDADGNGTVIVRTPWF